MLFLLVILFRPEGLLGKAEGARYEDALVVVLAWWPLRSRSSPSS